MVVVPVPGAGRFGGRFVVPGRLRREVLLFFAVVRLRDELLRFFAVVRLRDEVLRFFAVVRLRADVLRFFAVERFFEPERFVMDHTPP